MTKEEARVLKRKGRWGTTHFYIDGIPSLQGDYQITRNAFDTEQGAWDFLKGYDAAMSRTCEWVRLACYAKKEDGSHHGTYYEWHTDCGKEHMECDTPIKSFCADCGGRVVVKEAK